MLLFAYTPREPSIGTENMLRCAYRAGLREKMLLDNSGGSWKVDGGPEGEVSFGDAARPAAGFRQNEQQWQAGDPGNAGPDTPVDEDNGRCGNIPCHRVDDASSKNVSRQVSSSSGRCRPVLLAFRFSLGSSQRGILSTGQVDKYAHAGQACYSESAWLAEWESVFPGLSKRNNQSNVAHEGPNSARRRQQHLDARSSDGDGGAVGIDISNQTITSEYLWGSIGGDE